MSIIKAEKLEIEIQEQRIKDAGCKYLKNSLLMHSLFINCTFFPYSLEG